MKFFERFIVQRQPGQVTVLALVFLAIILAGSVALIDRSAIHTKKLRQTARKEQTLALAEAGLNAALVRINSSKVILYLHCQMGMCHRKTFRA